MAMVRLKIKEKNNKLRFIVIVLILLIILILILVFNPIASVKTKFTLKREQNMNKTPTYEYLKNTTIVGGNGKYSLPVIVGNATVNNDNTITVKAEPGTRVKSIDNGIISYIGIDTVYGNVIEISYTRIKKDELYAFYGYLDNPINGEVIAIQHGQKIGEVGESGYIHFELRDKNHNVVNPYKYMNLGNWCVDFSTKCVIIIYVLYM